MESSIILVYLKIYFKIYYFKRFLNLNRRLFELTDRHLLHYAPLVIKCDAWKLLNQQEQNRITESIIFKHL